jgi:hypothetical protein
MTSLFHRHLSREQYELAAETDPESAAQIRSRAAACNGCQEALTPDRLSQLLAAYRLPASIAVPVDWQAALKRAIAPLAQATTRRRPAAWRGLVLIGALAALLASVVIPAGAAGPDSVLYPVRGIEDQLIWSATQPAHRPTFEADLVATYLWQARESSDRHEKAAYQASMARVILWADRLKADLKQSPPADRGEIGATVSAGNSLLPELKSSSTNQEQDQAGQVGSILSDVQGQVQEGDGDNGGGGGG